MPVESHATDGFNVRFADQVMLDHCAIRWPANGPSYFGDSVSATNVTGLQIANFKGDSLAHPITFK